MRKHAVRRATRGGVIALLTATVLASTAADALAAGDIPEDTIRTVAPAYISRLP